MYCLKYQIACKKICLKLKASKARSPKKLRYKKPQPNKTRLQTLKKYPPTFSPTWDEFVILILSLFKDPWARAYLLAGAAGRSVRNEFLRLKSQAPSGRAASRESWSLPTGCIGWRGVLLTLAQVLVLLTPVSVIIRTEPSPVTSTEQRKEKPETATVLGLVFVALA